MGRYVIDAKTLVWIALEDVAVDPTHQLVAPGSIRSRALDLLLEMVGAGQLTEEEALRLHDRITELKLRLLNDRVSRRTAWKLAVEHGWATIAAAEHLAICKLQADALVTVDPTLAATAAGIVPVAGVEALTEP